MNACATAGSKIAISDLNALNSKSIDKTKSKNKDIFQDVISGIKGKIETIDDDTYKNLANLLALFNIRISDFIISDKSGTSIDIKGILNKFDDFIKNNQSVLSPDIDLSAGNTAENIFNNILKELDDTGDFPPLSKENHILDNESKKYTVDLSELKTLIERIRNSLKNGEQPTAPLKEDKGDTKFVSIKNDGKIIGDNDKNINKMQNQSQYEGQYQRQDQGGDTKPIDDVKSFEGKYTGIEVVKPNEDTSAIRDTKDHSVNENVKLKSNNKPDTIEYTNIFVKIKTPSFNEVKGEVVNRDFGKDILSQVSNGIKMTLSVGSGKSSAEIKLKPDHLGNILLALEVDKGIVTAKFTVQNEQVKSVIESNMNQLYDALKGQGYNVNDIVVSLDMSFNNGGRDESGGRQQNRNFIKINGKDAEKSFNLNMVQYDNSSINYLV